MMEEELERRAALVTATIEKLLPVMHPRGLYEASRHLVDSGGKRLRPSMLLLAAEAAGGEALALAPAAVSIELVHNFTLIHDDIMDNADVRRGRPAVHKIWGQSGAILAGDTLYSKAFQVLGMTAASPERILGAMNMLSRTCTAICEGQWLDMEFESKDRVTENEYMEMIEKKTGVLYGASAGMGALLAGAPLEVVRALDEFGRLTGMGFQLQDDVIDLLTPEEVSGKKQGGDLIEGKKTLIMIHAFANDIVVPVFSKKDASAEEIFRSISILEGSGSIEYARSRAEEMVVQGKRALDVLPPSPAKETLLELADYMIRRRY
ncbi:MULTISPECIES: polyprenyl synthetase family protein [Methanothrix]|jgi:geranylgeranyl diphosphate synthase, type I|nr:MULTISPECIES: polyprenyl synthetase family protein [Methanothrix]MDD3550906.1 polyprenyl synthetase family protein [Methanothrix soehngenii]HNY33967.1 polyprenyl synthetase family protein [Methanothrix soehngenii]HOE46162.1 polyprenyl synthetase family protein [Methanothrix soehngenii]HOS21152.1 polyprenyl synthetase family protein [Methanothrix soehngenii]HPL19589.1 polyprenyl synthetase family protein [Methanothrix soehngenii]